MDEYGAFAFVIRHKWISIDDDRMKITSRHIERDGSGSVSMVPEEE